MHCELLEVCGFFKKYRETLNLACRGFIKTYCEGPMMKECKRLEYRLKHGAPPNNDMMPSGQMVPEEYKQTV